ncbi:isoprenoid synthase domain-containing protein [Bisporella sp. PMI_857]|nr:isoprenoid synthase domain-containing protein [Bisporella sp. PMI_857]
MVAITAVPLSRHDLALKQKNRQRVLAELQNTTLKIDGLNSAFKAWPFKTNVHVDRARKNVNLMLQSRFPNHPKLRKLKAGDYGLFGATWWPCASYERLLVATYVSLWLFMWDDELDSDVGSIAGSFELGQRYRAETLKFVSNRLGLDGSEKLLTSNNEIINSFDYIGDALRGSCSVEQRERFMHEFIFFMNTSEVEQRLRLKENLVTVEEFAEYRLGTSAVRVVLSVNEYCNGTDLPSYIINDKDFESLWDLTNVNICNVNDLLSVKKEIDQGSAESLIPILFTQLGSTQKAVSYVMDTIHYTIRDFDATAQRLLTRFTGEDKATKKALEEFVMGCKYYCTGNLAWSMSTGRYGVHQDLHLDTITLVLGKTPASMI